MVGSWGLVLGLGLVLALVWFLVGFSGAVGQLNWIPGPHYEFFLNAHKFIRTMASRTHVSGILLSPFTQSNTWKSCTERGFHGNGFNGFLEIN